jgi:hypothetical protein
MLRRERDDGGAQSANESVHDRSKQRAAFLPGRGAERQPRQNLLLGHRPADTRGQRAQKVVESARATEQIGKLVDELVGREGIEERTLPS